MLLGALILLVSFIAAAMSARGVSDDSLALAGTNILLGAIGAIMSTLAVGVWHRQRATPLRMTRALLAGAVSICSGLFLFEPWVAFVIGAGAGLLAEFTLWLLELSGRRRSFRRDRDSWNLRGLGPAGHRPFR